MPALLSAPRSNTLARVDVLSPIDWSAPLNRGLLNWHLVLPHTLGGGQWRNLVRPAHATLTGAEPRSATSGWNATRRPGGFGEVRLNGVDGSGGSLASSAVYDFLNTTFTVSCWARTSVAATAELVSRRLLSAPEGSWFFRIDAAGTLTARITDSAGTGVIAQRTSPTTLLTNGQWHHLLVVFTTSTAGSAGNDVALYIDGRLDQGARTSSGTGYGASTRVVSFGTGAAFTGPLNGAMDDVRIAARGLAAREVQALYQASRTGYRRELRWLTPPLLLMGSAGTIRSLTAILVGTSTTPASSATLIRRLTSTLTGTSTTPPSSATLTRRLTATLLGSSTTAAASAVLGHRLQATLVGISTTPASSITLTRRLTSTLVGTSSTAAASVVLSHRLQAALAGTSSTPQSSATLARSLVSILVGTSSTPPSSATLTHRLTSTLVGTSSTPAASLVLSHRLQATLVGQSTTPAVAIQQVRRLTAQLAASSTTSTPTVQLPGQVVLTAQLIGQSATPAVALPVMLRRFTAQLQGTSTTPASTSAMVRRLTASLAGVSTTPASAIVLTSAITLTAVLVGSSTTPPSTLTLVRRLTATLEATSQTPASQVTTVRTMQAVLAGSSTTPDAVLLPASGVVIFMAQLVGLSQTSSASLVMLPTVRIGTVAPDGRAAGMVPATRIGVVPATSSTVTRIGIVGADLS